MPIPNMVAIRSTTVGSGGVSSIVWSDIPQTYTDLVLVLSVRTTRTGTYEGGIGIAINGNQSTGYTWRTIESQGSSTATNNTSYEPDWTSRINASQSTTGAFANVQVYIPSYTSSNAKYWYADGVAANNSSSAAITLLVGYQSSTSPITSLSIHDESNTLLTEFSTATLYGVTAYVGDASTKATGGIVTSDANYWYHVFSTSGNFTPNQALTADCLVVAGGGSGGADSGGGGGAGGFRTSTGLSLTATNYAVLVGAGGAAPFGTAAIAFAGSNSTFSSITSSGGGLGGSRGYNYPTGNTGGSGGSGGGGGGAESGSRAGGSGNAGSYSPSEGNNGGNGTGPAGNFAGGGGGGAGGAGGSASGTTGGNGGVGSTSTISGGATTGAGQNSGGTYYFAGGGGGGGGATAGTGGTGGGGNAGTAAVSGTNGTISTGGGGGGAGNSTSAGYGGAGGSGIVIIRYAK